MYNVLKGIIYAGNFKLEEIHHRIKQMHLLGELTEDQMFSLMELSNRKANAEGERPELLELVKNLAAKVDNLAAEVAALKAGEDHTDPDVEETEYKPWTSWDGISDKYQPGAIVTHNGKTWISVFEGQNVWEPGAVGDQFWEEYKDSVE